MQKILFALSILFSTSLSAQSIEESSKKFDYLLNVIDRTYVDSTSAEDLVEDAILGMLKELDPHSAYIAAEDVAKTNEGLVGNFEGIGIQFNIFKDTIMVVSPISGGPSEKLGIQSGDRICVIDGENVAGIGIKNDGVGKRLRGKKGTEVIVGIKRRGVTELIDYTIIRDKIPIFSMDAAYMATEDIGYIKINRFSATTMREFNKGLDTLETQGMKHLILDLRGNSGGYLSTAIKLADQFLEANKLIVYTEGRNFPKDEKFSTSTGRVEKGKLVVLINRGSASASEIVSGAVQDNDRGIIVGTRSFGKGLVQKPYKLPDGSIVRLTIQRYHSPTGRCIQKPYDDYKDDYTKRMESGELFHADSIDFPDSLKYTTPNGRTVYGGGGIMPDVFVPVDTSMSSTYYTNLLRKGVLYQFTLDYMDKHREELLEKYQTVDQFQKGFQIDKKLLDEFIAYGEKKKVEYNEEDFKISEKPIINLIKAQFARNLWNTSAYFQLYNQINPDFIKAIEVINDDSFDKMKLSY
ncbi:S41 family peptidase [Flavobacteriales bacterium]|nr:S41 family peptidase [Flavobacteriales bacterium]